MAKIVITGSTGCLGHRLALQRLVAGDEVIALGRDHKIGATLAAKGARFVAVDICDDLPDGLLNGVSHLYHCAAMSTAWGRRQDFEAVNFTATERLLNAAKTANVERFVFASTPSLYANGQDRLNVAEDETLPNRFATHYARTKFLAEQAVIAADQPGAMRTTAMRPRAIYGLGDRSLMPRILQAIKRGKVPMIAGGQALIDLTHVSDAAGAMALLAAHPQACGQVFNITSGEAYSFAQLLAIVSARVGENPRHIPMPYSVAMGLAHMLEGVHHLLMPKREPVLTRQAVASLGRSLTLDISKARQMLGYQPLVLLAEGVADYD